MEIDDDPDCIVKPSPSLGLLNMVNRCLVERLSFANVESPKVKEFQKQAELARFSNQSERVSIFQPAIETQFVDLSLSQ